MLFSEFSCASLVRVFRQQKYNFNIKGWLDGFYCNYSLAVISFYADDVELRCTQAHTQLSLSRLVRGLFKREAPREKKKAFVLLSVCMGKNTRVRIVIQSRARGKKEFLFLSSSHRFLLRAFIKTTQKEDAREKSVRRTKTAMENEFLSLMRSLRVK